MKINIEFTSEEVLSDEKQEALYVLLGFITHDAVKVAEWKPPAKKAASKKKVTKAAKPNTTEEENLCSDKPKKESIGFDGLRTIALKLAKKYGGSVEVLALILKVSGEEVIHPTDNTHWDALAVAFQTELDA